MPTCLFCKTTTGSFTKVEHIVPESLGNVNDVLPPGHVCDDCNQYLGSKVELPALTRTILAILRAAHGVPTKKGRVSRFECPCLTIEGDPEGYGVMTIEPPLVALPSIFPHGPSRVIMRQDPKEDLILARLMLKMGLEYLAISGFADPLSPRFDAARTFARGPARGTSYSIAMATLPMSEISSMTEDEVGPLEELTQYFYRLNGDPAFGYVFHFCYYFLHLCVPLSPQVDFTWYVGDFNALNPDLSPLLVRSPAA